MRRQTTGQEKLFTKDVLDKGLLSKIGQGYSKLNNKKWTNQIKNEQKIYTDIEMKIKHVKKDSTLPAIRE